MGTRSASRHQKRKPCFSHKGGSTVVEGAIDDRLDVRRVKVGKGGGEDAMVADHHSTLATDDLDMLALVFA